MEVGRIVKVSGPLIVAENMAESKMYDVVRVSERGLIGEIIELRGDLASIQVYEETSGLGPGEEVRSTGEPLSVELAPGLMEGIYDGIQRPLLTLREASGDHIARGVSVPAIDRDKKWDFVPALKPGDAVSPGVVLGTVQENVLVEHRILCPQGVEGKIEKIFTGSFTVEETVAVVTTAEGKKRSVCCRSGPSERADRMPRSWRPTRRSSRVSASSTLFSPSQRAASRRSPAPSGAARPSSSTSSPNGRMPT